MDDMVPAKQDLPHIRYLTGWISEYSSWFDKKAGLQLNIESLFFFLIIHGRIKGQRHKQRPFWQNVLS